MYSLICIATVNESSNLHQQSINKQAGSVSEQIETPNNYRVFGTFRSILQRPIPAHLHANWSHSDALHFRSSSVRWCPKLPEKLDE